MAHPDAARPLAEHLQELRRRVIISLGALILGIILTIPFAPSLLDLLLQPLLAALPQGTRLIALTPFEAFYATFTLALAGGMSLSAPIWCSQCLLFFAPALSPEMQRRSAIIGAIGGVLFIGGVLTCYAWVLPQTFAWAIAMTSHLQIQLLPRLDASISFVISLLAAFGLAFELPLLMAMLIRFGFLSRKTIRRVRPAAIVLAFLLGAILTPPDILSQIMLASLLILLFEIGILLGSFLDRGTSADRA